jgi:hypothetical protein
MVYTVVFKKIETAFRGFHILLFLPVHVAKVGKSPGTTALHPYALVCGIYFTFAVKACVNAAVFTV